MIRGIYTAASGMVAETIRTDAIANNLANGNTAGFKKDIAVGKDFASILIKRVNDGPEVSDVGSLGVGTMIDQVATIHTNGTMRSTGNTLDFALDGSGYFTVETPAGIRYTRNGTFSRNVQGELITSEGYQVLGQKGPIRIQGNNISVDDTGRIQVDGTDAGQLQIVDFADKGVLAKEGASLFRADGNVEPSSARVMQGFLEQSNVNIVSEMVNLIAGYRAYEVNAKTVQTHDQLLDKAVNEVSRV